jgi:hypothetical protein
LEALIMLDISDLNNVCADFTARSNIEVTEPAQRLLLSLINSVESDPHETWAPQEDRLPAYYGQWSTVLPSVLSQIVRDHGLQQRISTIDIAYWTGNNLLKTDFWRRVCPFPKPDETPSPSMGMFPWGLGSAD